MKTVSRVALAVAVAIHTGTVLAQEKQADDIERIEVAGEKQSGYLTNNQQGASKLDISLKDTPQMVSSISSQKIKDFALDDLNTALETSATINVEQVESDRTYFSSRGFAVNNFQIDGIGLPLANGNSHGRIDTALYEKIEVIHGANGIMTGIGSPSATVNLVRKRPTTETHANFSAQLSSWSGKRLQGDVSGTLTNNVRGRIVAVTDNSDSYLDRYSNDSQVFYGVLDYAPTADTLITIGHSEHRSNTDGPLWGALTLYYGDGTPTNFDRSTNIAADWSEWNVSESRSFIDVVTALNNDWSLRFAYNRERKDEDTVLFYTYLADAQAGLDPETGLGLIGYGSDYTLDEQKDTFDTYLSGNFNAWGLTHQVVVGASYARLDWVDTSLYDYHTGNGFPAMPALPEWDGNTPLPEFTDGEDGSVIDTTQKSVYAQTRLSLTKNAKLLLGGRFNQFVADGIGYGVDQSRDESQFIPYFGLTYALSNSTTVYGSYTETFMAQSERNRDFERLPPLTGKNSEVGIKSELFDGNALLSAAYFQVKQENLAVADGTAQNPSTNVPETVYRAAKEVESKGIEVYLSGEIAPGLNGVVAATAFDISGDETVESYTPEQLFRTSLTYSPSNLPQLKIGATYIWQASIYRNEGLVAEQYDNAGEPIIVRQDAYGRLNLMASYQFTEQLSLSLNANNVTDEKYINSLYWSQGYYGAPRNYSATLSYHF
ncbi:TonB-dependent siderophore receptor [Idiomarina tyrosinivorans]|uniref:TonB-dependent siderophore receptor n=1 Tax=Idiomarina tyrosinivorans TaxID=1445662 RepID=A0A432ZPW1_9GAMM|nr:TonB-dependent siderophore receptor [Idiomarina tyrosinivorans]RUO79975.1 TonB-dependent siderophore receptor [Idiomarina tyrosinivorans]